MKGAFSILTGIFVGIGSFFLAWWGLAFLELSDTNAFSASLLIGLIFGSFAWSIVPALMDAIKSSTNKVGNKLFTIPLSDLLGPIMGLIVGLIIVALLNSVIGEISTVGGYLSIFLVVVIPYVFSLIGYSKRVEIYELFSPSSKKERAYEKETFTKVKTNVNPKILDTSAIIDGRILYICRAGFIEGDIIVANYVLDELRHIADSEDVLRRAKGRRGLDVLNRMRSEFEGRVKVSDNLYPEIAEVDAKLLRLAQDLHGSVLTTDYNLNKVAQMQGVPVLNVNELSNAVKPVLIPGEEMTVTVIKEGKERSQGLAYLDDGTMIVVEDGRQYIGQTIEVVVTSVLQTSAGRMIFVRSK